MIGSNGCIQRTNREALHTYIVLDMAFRQQRDCYKLRNDELLILIENELVINYENDTVKNIRDRAMMMSASTKNILDFITEMKVELVMYTDEVSEDVARQTVEDPFLMKRRTNYKRTTHYFGTDQPPGEKGKAHELKIKLEQHKSFLLKFVDSDDIDLMNKRLNILDPVVQDDEQQGSWEMWYFYHAPLPGALAELTRLEVVIRQAEGDILGYLVDKLQKVDRLKYQKLNEQFLKNH